MAAPSYTWFPNIQVTPQGGGIQRISWDGFQQLDAPQHIPLSDFDLNAPIQNLRESDPGTRVDDVPLFPAPDDSVHLGDNTFGQPRFVGRGLYAYEITVDGTMINRVAADYQTTSYPINGCWNTYSGGGSVTGSTSGSFGPADEFGNPCIVGYDYARNLYIDPPTHYDMLLDTSIPHTIEINALFEQVPPWVHWDINSTVCVINSANTCQEALEGNYTRRKNFYFTNYPTTRKAGYVVGPNVFGANVPCTTVTCIVPPDQPGIFLVINTVTHNQGERYRLAGTEIILEGIWNLDGAKGMAIF